MTRLFYAQIKKAFYINKKRAALTSRSQMFYVTKSIYP